MTTEALVALTGAAALIITAIGGLTASVAGLISAFRKKDTAPAPQVGIPATAAAVDDIDYRAYLDMKERAETAEAEVRAWRRRALGIDDDTTPNPT